MAQTDRFFLRKITIKGIDLAPNGSVAPHLNFMQGKITFDAESKTLDISPDINGINLIFDKSLAPSNTNTKIALACLMFVRDTEGNMVGPFIKRASSLSTFPNKLSFA